MSNLRLATDLDRIERGIERLGLTATIGFLRDGMPADHVREALHDVGLSSSPELEAWYAWHDGAAGGLLGELWITPGFYPCTLEEVVANYRTFVGDERWRTGWLPLLADGGGDFFVVDQSDPLWPIRIFLIDEIDRPVTYLSLTALAATLADAFDESAIVLDESGTLDFLDELGTDPFVGIARRHNPGVEWWTD